MKLCQLLDLRDRAHLHTVIDSLDVGADDKKKLMETALLAAQDWDTFFYPIESNRHGNGIKNDSERGHIAMTLSVCAEVLEEVMGKIVVVFQDVENAGQEAESACPPPPEKT